MQVCENRCCSYFRWYGEDGYGRDNKARENKLIAIMARKIDEEMNKPERALKIALLICIFVIILLFFAYEIK